MLPREFARLAIKIIGLAMVVYGLCSLPSAVGWFFAADVPNRAWTALTVGVGPAIVWALIGVGLFYGAGRIVERSFQEPGQAPVPALDLRAIEEIAIAVLGLYFLAAGIAEGAYYWARIDLFYRYLSGLSGYTSPVVPRDELGGIAAAVARVVLGILLFLGSRGISVVRRYLLGVRTIDERDDENNDISARH